MADVLAPADNWSTSAETTITRDQAMHGLAILDTHSKIVHQVYERQRAMANGRLTSEQWLDENEREWDHMDSMLRSRPWATNKDKSFKYPFKDATNEMRRYEGQWVGDDRILAPESTRFDAEDDVLVHVRPTLEYPPGRRVILFTPEFGSAKSYDMEVWSGLQPENDCDVWVCSWQGWASFDAMIPEVCRKLLSFGDGCSTVWFGHSTGALVAYEMLKKFEGFSTPNLPVALIVSGCPAPFLFSKEYEPAAALPMLSSLRYPVDLDSFTSNQKEELQRQFQMCIVGRPSHGHRQTMLGDLRLIKKYRCKRAETDRKIVLPILAFSYAGDPLVTEDSIKSWSEISAPGFEFVSLPFDSDNDKCHGYARRPVSEVIQKINAWTTKHKRVTDLEQLLKMPICDIGPTDGVVPEKIDWVVVGAGIAGVHATVDAYENGLDVVSLDRHCGIGGVWNFYANVYSRVNTSEIGYRMVDQQGPASRPNEDHSPTHDIMRDIHTVAHRAKGCFRCNKEVTKVDGQQDGTYIVHGKDINTGKEFEIKCKGVVFCTNRRLGARRYVPYPCEESFLGEIRYGYAGEVHGLNFWGRKVIVVGAGAFAFENLRTSLEHGAKHCTILGRRAGTTCPKWIDMIAYLRPMDESFHTNKIANAVSFECWRKCYNNAMLPTPECWEEGLLKPHNHTVSVSDMAYIGGFHGLVALRVGEIKAFQLHGQGVRLKDGTEAEVDIVIKATGFHLADQVPKLSGTSKMHPWGNLKFNMFYSAEPLLDGGQFGSTKGKVAIEGDDDNMSNMTLTCTRGIAKLKELGLPTHLLTPMGNPFGSGYQGPMLYQTHFVTYLMQHPEEQKLFLECVGEPRIEAAHLWASSLGAGTAIVVKHLVQAILD